MAANDSRFVYVTYIRTTPEKLWEALTTPDFMTKFWFGMHVDSQWTEGSPWKLLSSTGEVYDGGTILTAEPPKRLVMTWQHQNRPELKAEGESHCTIELEPIADAVKLTITHAIARENSKLIEAVSGGWPKILSNLKSLLETGTIALNDPYRKA